MQENVEGRVQRPGAEKRPAEARVQAKRPGAEKQPTEGRVQAKRPGAEKRVPSQRRQGPDWEQGARGGQQWEPAGQAKQRAVRGARQERARVQ